MTAATPDATTVDALTDALLALVRGDRATARRLAAGHDTLLAAALVRRLDGDGRTAVYGEPAAFRAFIDGGGNVPLYEAVSDALAALYPAYDVDRLLDLGCGDGRAVVPALRRTDRRPGRVELVEPSPALLAVARERAADLTGVTAREATAQEVADDPDAGPWDLVQSTFALQSLTPQDCSRTLAALLGRTRRLAVVDFDMPDLVTGSPEHVRSLVRRYEVGLAEYAEDPAVLDLVAQGFLLPVLLGQVDPATPRTNWEQPAVAWADQVAAAGYAEVHVVPLADYWSGPTFLLTARGTG